MHIVTQLQNFSVLAAALIGQIGVLIMVYGGLKNGAHFILHSLRNSTEHLPRIRIDLGKHLSLGLEFLVGKDIIESIISPTWDELGKLAAIIFLRTLVTIVLSWELKELKAEVEAEEMHAKA